MSVAAFFAAAFLGVCLIGIVAVLLLPERAVPMALGVAGVLASAALGVASGLLLTAARPLDVPLWTIAEVGALALSVDPLSALFGATTAIVYLAGSIFAASYLARHRPSYGARAFAALYLLLLAVVPLVLAAADVVSLLGTWELMSVLIYLLIVAGRGRAAWRAGYLALALGEAGALALIVGLLVAATHAGGTGFPAIRAAAPRLGDGARWAVFLLTFLGFGVKAGLVPVNMWLPRAYAAAPGGFAPVLAGATLNLGLYGIVRTSADLVPQTSIAPGLVVLLVGAVSALIGILYATTENDLKAMLGHSSIENAGIVTVGLGAGMVFTTAGHATLAAIAFVAALYHLVNHSVYKTLLFAGAGAVGDGVGGRDMDRLGGLAKRMPWTAALFLVGALAISAIPPLNGFVSEWLTLQALLRGVELQGVGERVIFAVAGAGVALTAALAVTAFVKAFAMTFLGLPRSAPAEGAAEAPRGMRGAMAILAAAVLALGLLPTYVIPVLDRAAAPLAGASATVALVPDFFAPSPAAAGLPSDFAAEFHDLGAQVGGAALPGRGLVVLHRGGSANPVVYAMSTSYMAVVLVVLLGLAYAVAWALTRARTVVRAPRWDGGVRRYLPEMTYTATGFSNPVRVIFAAVFRPTTVEDTRETVAKHFTTAIRREYVAPHVVERYFLAPVEAGVARIAALFARMHNGRISAYAMYVLLALLLLMAVARFA